MHVFGLTGGIASGKSTVSARFAARGVPVVDADRVARDVVAPGSAGLRQVVAAFGDGILDSTGRLDRKALGTIVFRDAAARAKLNAIMHPLVAARTAERTATLAAEGALLVCYDAALLVENGLAPMFRPLVVVATSEATQVARLLSRDGLDQASAMVRIRAQLSLDEKRHAADYVIENDTSLGDLITRADEVLDAVTVGCELPIFPPKSS